MERWLLLRKTEITEDMSIKIGIPMRSFEEVAGKRGSSLLMGFLLSVVSCIVSPLVISDTIPNSLSVLQTMISMLLGQ